MGARIYLRLMNTLVVNCTGIGDGLIEVPFLAAVGDTVAGFRFFHTGSALFDDTSLMLSLGLRGYAGTVPAKWRKFHRDDWQAIDAFLVSNEIDSVLNLRHVGPTYDTNYYRFKARARGTVQFLDFDFESPSSCTQNIRSTIEQLLRSHSLIDTRVDHQYLQRTTSRASLRDRQYIAVNVHAGSPFKRWPLHKWASLCRTLTSQGHIVGILAGYTDEEVSVSAELVKSLERDLPHSTFSVPTSTLIEALGYLADATCAVTANSWPAHAASGLGIPTVDLHIVTSSVMWGGAPAFSRSLVSRHLTTCANYDRLLGICKHNYAPCPAMGDDGDGIDVADVLAAIADIADDLDA